MPTTRDIPFDEHTPEAPTHVRENFTDIRPLAEVEAMRRRWAGNLDRAHERLQAKHGKSKDCSFCGAFSARCAITGRLRKAVQ